MFKVHELFEKYTDELAQIVVEENGKNYAEAVASVAKGNEPWSGPAAFHNWLRLVSRASAT